MCLVIWPFIFKICSTFFVLDFLTLNKALALSSHVLKSLTHLPQAQKENEGNNESAHRYTVTEVVYDEGYLVVHGVLPLWKTDSLLILT